MMMKKTAILLLISSIILTATAQILMKTGMLGLGELRYSLTFLQQLLSSESMTDLLIIFSGLVCYGLSMIAWIGVLTRIELSIAYPFLSISYILVYLAALLLPWLNESFSLLRFSGIIFIGIGLILITRCHTTREL